MSTDLQLHDNLVGSTSALGDGTFVRVRPLNTFERAEVTAINHTAFEWTAGHTASVGDVGCVVGGSRCAHLSVVAFMPPPGNILTGKFVTRIYHDALLDHVITSKVDTSAQAKLLDCRIRTMMDALRRKKGDLGSAMLGAELNGSPCDVSGGQTLAALASAHAALTTSHHALADAHAALLRRVERLERERSVQ